MNSKKARVLRKEAGFHPNDERKQRTIKKLVSKTETRVLRVENEPSSTRGVYRALKSSSRT